MLCKYTWIIKIKVEVLIGEEYLYRNRMIAGTSNNRLPLSYNTKRRQKSTDVSFG